MSDPNEIRITKKLITDGLKPVCPICRKELIIGQRQDGASGSYGYPYKCSTNDCTLQPGFAYEPWRISILKAFQKKIVQIVIAAIGAVTLTGLIGFGTGLLSWGSNKESSAIIEIQQQIDRSTNNFEQKELNEIIKRYTQITREHRVDFSNGRENPFIMSRAANAANQSIQGIGAWSPEGWTEALNPYFLANIQAIERGAQVKRIFVIPESITSNNIELLIKVMKKQCKTGIRVYFAYKDELQRTEFYSRNPFYSCVLFDNKYFGYDLRTEYWDGRYPSEIRITWDKKEIEEKSPFPNIFNSPYVYPFDSLQISAHIKNHLNK
jgi:hypothetical protein